MAFFISLLMLCLACSEAPLCLPSSLLPWRASRLVIDKGMGERLHRPCSRHCRSFRSLLQMKDALAMAHQHIAKYCPVLSDRQSDSSSYKAAAGSCATQVRAALNAAGALEMPNAEPAF